MCLFEEVLNVKGKGPRAGEGSGACGDLRKDPASTLKARDCLEGSEQQSDVN